VVDHVGNTRTLCETELGSGASGWVGESGEKGGNRGERHRGYGRTDRPAEAARECSGSLSIITTSHRDPSSNSDSSCGGCGLKCPSFVCHRASDPRVARIEISGRRSRLHQDQQIDPCRSSPTREHSHRLVASRSRIPSGSTGTSRLRRAPTVPVAKIRGVRQTFPETPSNFWFWRV